MADHPHDRPQDQYRYLPDEVAELRERITMEPVPPDEIVKRAEDGVLVTADIPEYLDSGLAPDVDTAVALYRMVQLFGTPNVPGLEAGADQGTRERTTWQYLFRVVDRPEDGPSSEFLLSVYDDRTTVSVGFSEFRPVGGDGAEGVPAPAGDRVALEPSGDPLSGGMPEEGVLRSLVKLVLSTVEHAVEATYKGLHI